MFWKLIFPFFKHGNRIYLQGLGRMTKETNKILQTGLDDSTIVGWMTYEHDEN